MCQVVCECGRSDAHIYKTKQAAIDAWNTRATPKVKPLVWENFDAWTWWARKPHKKTGGRVINND